MNHPRAPLLIRLLDTLPGPWWVWLTVAVSLNIVVAAAVLRSCTGPTPSLASVAFFSATCLLGGWGTLWSWRRIEGVRALVARLTGDAHLDPFAGAGSMVWPIALAIFAPVPYFMSFASNCPRGAVFALYLTGSIAAFPLMSGFWLYVIVALGLHRIGARPLRLDSFERDRSLGLRPLGSLAFGFYLLYAAINTSLTIVTSYGRVQLLSYLAFAILGLAMFFMQMRGLRRQMLMGKAAHASWAKDLYASAIEALRRDSSPEGLDRESRRVLAASEIKREVAAIQEWPADDGIVRTAVAIGTSIVAAILARLILSRVGL